MKPFVKVTWWDAEDFKEKGWASEDEAHEFTVKKCEVFSYGFLVSKTKSYVSLAADFTPDPDTYGRIIKIPKKMTTKIEELFPAPDKPTS